LDARTRAKPRDALWKLWFGNNDLVWGLLIAPDHRGGEWTNDVSEIRRAKYQYWTIGHVLETGIIDPEQDEPITFPTLGDLLKFNRSILKRVSKSKYEKAIFEQYEEYLEESDDHDAEPFLIPELRYAGLDAKHRYRLDFSILNPHTMTYTGFELSPHSTHGAVTGAKGKTQKQINQEQAAWWGGEMQKRNEYFEDFGITTITFTDDQLADMGTCFKVMAKYLRARKDQPVLSREVARLKALHVGSVTSWDW
jgi:hypothetical protein